MRWRPRQREFVTRCVTALKAHGNTLGVAPTGAGKTICLSGTAGEFLQHPDAKACILAHRDELTAQNLAKFGRVNPHVSTSIRSEEHTSELQSLMRNSYAVFCLKKKTIAYEKPGPALSY